MTAAALRISFAVSLVFACSSGGASFSAAQVDRTDAAQEPGEPDEGGEADAAPAPDAGKARKDAGRDGEVADAKTTGDGAMDDAAPTTPVDPLCELEASGVPFFGNETRDEAALATYHPSMLISGVLRDGTNSGDVTPHWVVFDVDAPRMVDIKFSPASAFAAFYYEDEATHRFSVGGPAVQRKTVTLEAGRYYVKIADIYKRYFGAGKAFELYISWTTPPAVCVDAGTADASP